MLLTTTTKRKITMTKRTDTAFFENKLQDFVTAKDPVLEMMQWVMDKFMEIELPIKREQKKEFFRALIRI